MTARKFAPALRAVIFSFALLLAVAFALSAQVSALSTEANGSDAVTGATPQTPQMQDGQMPQMPSGEMPQFSDGQMPQFSDGQMPQLPNGETPQFSDGQMPQLPNGEMPQFSDGQAPQFSDGQMPQLPNGEMPQFFDGQMPQLPEGFSGFGGENSETSPFDQQAPAAESDASADAEAGQRADADTRSGDSSGLTRVGSGLKSGASSGSIWRTSAFWALLGFGCALILCSTGLLIYALVKHRKAKAASAAQWIEMK